MDQIIFQRLRNVLIDGTFPSETVTVKGVSFEFTFTDSDISRCNTVSDCIEFLSKVVKCSVRNDVVQLTDLPSVYFYPVQTAYSEFQYTMLSTLLAAVKEFVKSAESYGLWLTYSHSDPSYVLSINRKLNLIQQRWIALNAMNDSKRNTEMVTNIFDAAKPWLDKELYVKMREHSEEMRENVFFDDDTYDAKLREKAKQVAAAQQKAAPKTDSDIIVVEED